MKTWTLLPPWSKNQLKPDRGDFAVGDTVRVHVNVVEGERRRIQVFEGTVIKKQGSGIRGDLHCPQDLPRRRG